MELVNTTIVLSTFFITISKLFSDNDGESIITYSNSVIIEDKKLLFLSAKVVSYQSLYLYIVYTSTTQMPECLKVLILPDQPNFLFTLQNLL